MLGLGCMRLSTGRDRDDERAIAVVHAALDGGVTLLDTADAYCWDDSETGHNERLVARALATWSGDRSAVHVATKGGLTRPGGEWIPDGRARHLSAACEASGHALGMSRIPLYQLHAPDPRVSFATSVRALANLQRNGCIERVGLCNVTVGQLAEARRIVDIHSVQVELNPSNDGHFLSGIAGECINSGIQLIAARPFGGVNRARRIANHPVLTAMASRHRASPFEIVLAWLADLAPNIVTIPGPTSEPHAATIGRAAHVVLTDDDRALLDSTFIAAGTLRTSRRAGRFAPSQRRDGEVVLIMGLPGAGKTTLARRYESEGYARVNRDEDGGSLRQLLPVVERQLEGGHSRIVLDNTYVSRKSRAAVVQAMTALGLPVKCVWLATTLEDAQVNAAWRMVERYGRLLSPDEIRETVKRDVNAFGPGVQFRYQRELEPPDVAEGFADVDTVSFTRSLDASFCNRALLIWCDGVLTDHPERDCVVRRYAGDGWRVLGIGWQQQIDGHVYEQLEARIGVDMDVEYCPHGGGPPVCWCRKPLPGLGVLFIHRYRLDPAACLYVGSGPQDPGYARKLGFQYRSDQEFFAC